MEGDGLRLDLSLLNVDLVTGEDNGDVFADADEVACGGFQLARSNFCA